MILNIININPTIYLIGMYNCSHESSTNGDYKSELPLKDVRVVSGGKMNRSDAFIMIPVCNSNTSS